MFWGPTHVRSSPNSPQMLEALDACRRLCKKVCAYRSLWLTQICYARPASLCPVVSPWWSIHLLSWCWRTALYLCTEGSCTCRDSKHALNLEILKSYLSQEEPKNMYTSRQVDWCRFLCSCHLMGLTATSVSLAWTLPTTVPAGAFSSTSNV